MPKPTDPDTLLEALLDAFGHPPTGHQYKAFHGLARFLLTDKPRPAFVLNGAAGTGKTTMMRAVVRILEQLERLPVLLAPTGRAAKVLARRVGRNASTVHRYIYSSNTDAASGSLRFRRRRNDDPPGTVYLVDEASMIGESSDSNLLEDLVDFVHAPGSRNFLVFIGDTAQLPPIGTDRSPALVPAVLRQDFDLTAGQVTMTDVKRQALESGILYNATRLRTELERPDPDPEHLPTLYRAPDVTLLDDGQDLLDRYLGLYHRDAPDRCVVLTYSNYLAVQVNQAIRLRLYDDPEALLEGDSVMVVKNFYQTLAEALPFIANGDAGTVTRVFRSSAESRYGLDWCDVTVAFADLDAALNEITAKVPLGLLTSKDAALPYPDSQRVYLARRQDHAAEAELEATRTGRKPARFDPRLDTYVNALQLKYGYAITGHKAQGGQWQHVFVAFEPSLGRLRAEDHRGFLRWVYTAFTRAAEHLYLLNCPFPLSEVPPATPAAELDDDGLDTFR